VCGANARDGGGSAIWCVCIPTTFFTMDGASHHDKSTLLTDHAKKGGRNRHKGGGATTTARPMPTTLKSALKATKTTARHPKPLSLSAQGGDHGVPNVHGAAQNAAPAEAMLRGKDNDGDDDDDNNDDNNNTWLMHMVDRNMATAALKSHDNDTSSMSDVLHHTKENETETKTETGGGRVSAMSGAIASAGAYRNTAAAAAIAPMLHHDEGDDKWLIQVLDRNTSTCTATLKSHGHHKSTIGKLPDPTGNAEPTATVDGVNLGQLLTCTINAVEPETRAAYTAPIMNLRGTPVTTSSVHKRSDKDNPTQGPHPTSAMAWEEEVAIIPAKRVTDSLSLDSTMWDSWPPPSHNNVAPLRAEIGCPVLALALGLGRVFAIPRRHRFLFRRSIHRCCGGLFHFRSVTRHFLCLGLSTFGRRR
jgi:hypothetical protein